jgi:hypothetical protein
MASKEQEKASVRDRLRGRLRARRERRGQRAKVAADLERGRVERGEVGRYGVGDNSGFSSPM